MMMLNFFVFDHKYLSRANLFPKIENCLFKVKFDTKTNSNMQNSMAGVYFICFGLKIATLFGKFGPKSCNCQFKLKIGA